MKKQSHVFFERNSWYHRTKTLNPDHTVKYGKKGGFESEEEAEKAYQKHIKEYENELRKFVIVDKKEITFKNYLIYWFESIYSSRIENSSQMLGAYVLYNLIFPSLEKDIKLRYVHIEFLDELLLKASEICESAGNKVRELLNIAFNDAILDGFLTMNPVKRN